MKRQTEHIILVFILCLSLFLNLYNNDFPLGYHPDEIFKIHSIKTDMYSFTHPILMLQVVQALNLFFDFSKEQDLVWLGRISSALFGTLIVLFSYCLFSNLVGAKYALMISFTIATSPILVVHAHYLKEDIILTCFIILYLYGLFRFIETPSIKSTVFLGLISGFTISSKYTGILIFVLLAIVPLITNINNKRDYGKKVGCIFGIALCVFSIVNYPIFFHFDTFKKGFNYELNHVVTGHLVKFNTVSYLFSFHFLNSIIPGITLMLALLSLIGLTLSMVRFRSISWQNKILLMYTGIFYFVIEFSPLKPHPGYMRYAMPIIPTIIYFAYRGMITISSMLGNNRLRFLNAILFPVILSLPFYDSVNFVYHLNLDTRNKVEQMINLISQMSDASTKRAFSIEKYASEHFEGTFTLARSNLDEEKTRGITHFVVSSFTYDRFLRAGKLKGQEDYVYILCEKYQALFDYPFIEIEPSFKTFAFSNPTIRIIDVR